MPNEFLVQHPRRFKLNSPYIQQLHQRYSAWHGRVGVPAVNDLIKNFNNNQVAGYKAQLAAEKAQQEAAAAAVRKAGKQAEKAQRLREQTESAGGDAGKDVEETELSPQ